MEKFDILQTNIVVENNYGWLMTKMLRENTEQ